MARQVVRLRFVRLSFVSFGFVKLGLVESAGSSVQTSNDGDSWTGSSSYAGSAAASAANSSQNTRASSRAEVRRKAAQQDEQRFRDFGARRFAEREHAFHHTTAQSGRPADRPDKADLVLSLQRSAERRECRFRQARARQQRSQACAATVVHQRSDPA